jgi:hypothetical protein
MKTAKKKRPPAQVWLVVDDSGAPVEVFRTKRSASGWVGPSFHVAGPYVLAERVRQM